MEEQNATTLGHTLLSLHWQEVGWSASGLEESVNEAKLHSAFIPFGDIKDVNIPLDNTTGKHRGFAFVEFEDKDDAAAATDNMHNSELYVFFLQQIFITRGQRNLDIAWGQTVLPTSLQISGKENIIICHFSPYIQVSRALQKLISRTIRPLRVPASCVWNLFCGNSGALFINQHPSSLTHNIWKCSYGRVLRVNYAQPMKIKGGDKGFSHQPVWADADNWWARFYFCWNKGEGDGKIAGGWWIGRCGWGLFDDTCLGPNDKDEVSQSWWQNQKATGAKRPLLCLRPSRGQSSQMLKCLPKWTELYTMIKLVLQVRAANGRGRAWKAGGRWC